MKVPRLLLPSLWLTLGAIFAEAQGPLAPAAAPAPQGRTLEQLEPRIDLQRTVNPIPGDFNSQIVISSPGSYYLSANLVVTKPDGIRIAASGVTLDLRGFTISHATSGSAGIRLGTGIMRCTVQNGTVTGFSAGVSLNSSPFPRGTIFRRLHASGCGTGFLTADDAMFQDCTASGNTGTGFSSINGAILRNCVAANNGGAGIQVGAAGVLEGCSAMNNAGTYAIQAGTGSTLSNCVSTGNTGNYGIIVGFGSVLRNCVARGNTSSDTQSGGFFVNAESILSGCVATNNTNNAGSAPRAGAGITTVSDVLITNCVVQGNSGDGIQVGDGSFVRENNCDGNGNAGAGANIRATGDGNRIEGNHLTNGRRGVELEGTGSIVLRNSARANAINYVFTADNRYGPVVNLTAAGTAAVNGSGPAASTLTSADGTANYAQ